jgi:hypothetical protein
MNWQNGYFFSTYRPGKVEGSGGFLGGLIGKLIGFLPYIAAATLIYRPKVGDGNLWLWNGIIFALIAMSLVILKNIFLMSLQRKKTSNWRTISVYWLAVLGVLFLQLWVLNTAIERWMAPNPVAHGIALTLTAIFLLIALLRWAKTRWMAGRLY